MLVSQFTKDTLHYRRAVKSFVEAGFIKVSENGHPLGKLNRGAWYNLRIDQVQIAPGGHELWIKLSEPTAPRPRTE